MTVARSAGFSCTSALSILQDNYHFISGSYEVCLWGHIDPQQLSDDDKFA